MRRVATVIFIVLMTTQIQTTKARTPGSADINFRAKITGTAVMAQTVHPCNNKSRSAKERWNAVWVEVDPPITITARMFGEEDLKTYRNVRALYVKVDSPVEVALLANMESESERRWRYRTAQGACLEKTNEEELFLFGLTNIRHDQ